jgi:hypothetical protein
VPQADNTAALIQLLLSLSNQGENTYQDALGNSDSTWGALGQQLPDLLNTFSSLYRGRGSGGTISNGGRYGVYSSNGDYVGE